MRKASILSGFLGMFQLLTGALAIMYVGYMLLKAGPFSAMDVVERRFYSSLVLQYCGGGACYILTGACIMSRQHDAVPILALMTGCWTLLFSIATAVKTPEALLQVIPVMALVSVYLIWFGIPEGRRVMASSKESSSASISMA